MVLAMPLVIAAPHIGTSLAFCCTSGPLRVRIISSFLTHVPGRHPTSISMLAIMLPTASRYRCAAIAESNRHQQNDHTLMHLYLLSNCCH
jgi:hypothetical protein